MTLKYHTPVALRFALISLLLIIFTASSSVWAKDKRPVKAKPIVKTKPVAKAKSTRVEKNKREDRGREKSAKDSRSDKRRDKTQAKEDRSAKKDKRKEDNKSNRRLSKRERLLEARRQAEQRRREIEEARRRAELARQAALARQRAADQALRDETAANILRDDTLGEDLEVRRAAVAALGNHAGSVIVMDPKTGRIYSVVNQEWAVRCGYKPCSTIKLVTGLAGLSEKVIDPAQTVNVSASNYSIDLTDSLAYSNNGYFQSVGSRVGFDRMVTYARELGLGERTGINHANEYAGRVPIYKSGYAVNHMSSHGDDFEVTPIQLASLVSAIANGGDLLAPHLPRTPQEDVNFKREVRRKLSISQDSLRRMIPGMIGAVNYGTAKLAYDPLQTIAGKTGTCIGQGSWLGLFTSYAPVTDPRLAVVVVTRGSGERGRVAAGIAGRVYRALDGRFGRINGAQIATTPATLTPHTKLKPGAAAILSDEDREADAATDANAGIDANANSNSGASDAASVTTTDSTRSTVKTISKPITPAQTITPPVTPTESTVRPDAAGRQRRVLTNRP